MDTDERLKLVRRVQRIIPDLREPFTTYDVYMELISERPEDAPNFDNVKSILGDLEDEHVVIRPPELDRGWWRVPSTVEDIIQIAREMSSDSLSGAMEAALEAGIKYHGKHCGPGVIPSSLPPYKQTIHALERRGLAEYRNYGDGSPRRSGWYLEPTLEEYAQHREREMA